MKHGFVTYLSWVSRLFVFLFLFVGDVLVLAMLAGTRLRRH